MEFVEPIRTQREIEKCYKAAIKHDSEDKYNTISWELLLLVGFSTALRSSDLVRLKAKDFRESDVITVKALKTGKKTTMGIPANVRNRILEIIEPLSDEDYIFRSRMTKTAVKRHCLYYTIKSIAAEAGIKTAVGTHTLRKTFAYHFYKKTGDIAALQDILQHETITDTLRYIGISEELRNKQTMSFTAIVPKYLK